MLVLSGGITIGFLQAYLQYINQISEPISTASYVINSIQAAMASIDRIFVILDEADEQPEATHLETIFLLKEPLNLKCSIWLHTRKILMKNVDFSVQPKNSGHCGTHRRW